MDDVLLVVLGVLRGVALRERTPVPGLLRDQLAERAVGVHPPGPCPVVEVGQALARRELDPLAELEFFLFGVAGDADTFPTTDQEGQFRQIRVYRSVHSPRA